MSEETALPMRPFRLGLLGLGEMGVPIAQRLLAQGWRVTVWDVDAGQFEAVKDAGATWVATPAAVRAATDIVLICLADDLLVEEACFGVNGLGTAKGAHIVIDLSTTSVETTQRAAAELDVAWLDSPLTGTPEMAGAGKLTLMVGGTTELFDWVKRVLDDLGGNVTHMGPLGAGQTTKLINQAIVGTTYVLMGEILAQVRAAGIDGGKLAASLKGGPADSALFQEVFPKIFARAFEPGALPAGALNRDLMAVREFNESLGLNLPVQDVAIDQYRHYAEDGNEEADAISVSLLYDTDPQ